MTVLSLSAQQILNCPTAEKLFHKEQYAEEFIRLRSKWHPDKNSDPQATDVFQHIIFLAEEAKGKIATNTWAGKASIQFTTSTNKTYKFKYLTMLKFELGKMYIGQSVLMYVIDPEFEDLYDNGIKRIKNIRYPDAKLKTEFSRLLPSIKVADKKSSIGMVAVLDKPKDSVLLQDLINYMPDKQIDPKHVAWITSSLYNIATFLDITKQCHNSIMPSTVFVDPKNHAVFLLGGWWYASEADSKISAIPRELLKVLPKEIFDTKVAKTAYDRKAVKGVAIGCLGDPSLVGSKLLARKDVPPAMVSWIRSPSSAEAIEEFTGWAKALEKSFGKRKFIKFDINITEIYQ